MELIRCAVNSGNETLYGGFNAIGKVLATFISVVILVINNIN